MPIAKAYSTQIWYNSVLNLDTADTDRLTRVAKLAINTEIRRIEQKFVEDRQGQCREQKV